jgi:hypothetical protein
VGAGAVGVKVLVTPDVNDGLVLVVAKIDCPDIVPESSTAAVAIVIGIVVVVFGVSTPSEPSAK